LLWRCVQRRALKSVVVAVVVDLGDAEVQNTGKEPGGREFFDNDIFRLDVAVDDAAGMGFVQSIGDLDGDRDRVVDGQSPVIIEQCIEGRPVDVVHDEPEDGIVELQGFKDIDDVRIFDLTDGVDFAIKAVDHLLSGPVVEAA